MNTMGFDMIILSAPAMTQLLNVVDVVLLQQANCIVGALVNKY